MTIEIYRIDDVAKKLGKSKRWLQDFLMKHPCGRRAGRTRIFLEEDVAKLVLLLPKEVDPFPRKKAGRPITGSAGRTSKLTLTEALRLVNEKSRKKS
jgi:hypothetical protein